MYVMQARSSSSGQMVTWKRSSPDWAGEFFPGPGTPQYIAALDASTPAGDGAFAAGGDLSGTSTSQTVSKVRGATVGTAAGSLATGNVLKVTGASTIDYGPVNLAGGGAHVTGTLPFSNQAAQPMGGDCSGTTASCTVGKINGVTISGTPVAGKSLRCTSGTAASWGPVDLSDTTNAVTGTLPGTSVGVAVGGVTPSAGAMSSSDKTKLDGIQTQGAPVALVGAGSTNIDWSQSQTFTKTISSNTTLTMSNIVVGGQVSVEITAGSGNTVTFTNPSGMTISWPGGTQPTQTSGKTDVYTFLATSSSTIRALVAQNY